MARAAPSRVRRHRHVSRPTGPAAPMATITRGGDQEHVDQLGHGGGPAGHLAEYCRAPGCRSVWYRPRHDPRAILGQTRPISPVMS